MFYLLSCVLLSSFQVVTDILHLQGQKLTAYKGNYDTFERTREEQIKNQQKAFESSERSRAHMQVSFVGLLYLYYYLSFLNYHIIVIITF